MAVFLHALFDYFIIGPFNTLFTLISFFMAIFAPIIYGQMITESLNLSPFYSYAKNISTELRNDQVFWWMMPIMISAIYLIEYFTLATVAANFNLLGVIIFSMYPFFVLLGSLGVFRLQHKKYALLKFDE